MRATSLGIGGHPTVVAAGNMRSCAAPRKRVAVVGDASCILPFVGVVARAVLVVLLLPLALLQY